MKKKITLASLLTVLSSTSLAYACGMGEQSNLCYTGFMSLEGGYTVSSIDNYNFTLVGVNTTLTSVKSSQHYSGRLAAGMINMMDDQFGITGELGWGYYGRTTLKPTFASFGTYSVIHTLSGFDALLGVSFIQPSYSLSFKAGALIQNMATQVNASSGELSPSFDPFTTKTNQSAALPEIKLGGSYNFDSNWALTAAYLFALGSSNKTTGTYNIGTSEASLNSKSLNPSMNSLLLGLQYTI